MLNSYLEFQTLHAKIIQHKSKHILVIICNEYILIQQCYLEKGAFPVSLASRTKLLLIDYQNKTEIKIIVTHRGYYNKRRNFQLAANLLFSSSPTTSLSICL